VVEEYRSIRYRHVPLQSYAEKFQFMRRGVLVTQYRDPETRVFMSDTSGRRKRSLGLYHNNIRKLMRNHTDWSYRNAQEKWKTFTDMSPAVTDEQRSFMFELLSGS